MQTIDLWLQSLFSCPFLRPSGSKRPSAEWPLAPFQRAYGSWRSSCRFVAFEWQARCFLLTIQRYYIPVAVYEYFTRNFYFFCDYFSFPDFVGRMCCSVDFRRQLLALGIAQASSALLSLLQLLQCCSSLKGISIP